MPSFSFHVYGQNPASKSLGSVFISLCATSSINSNVVSNNGAHYCVVKICFQIFTSFIGQKSKSPIEIGKQQTHMWHRHISNIWLFCMRWVSQNSLSHNICPITHTIHYYYVLVSSFGLKMKSKCAETYTKFVYHTLCGTNLKAMSHKSHNKTNCVYSVLVNFDLHFMGQRERESERVSDWSFAIVLYFTDDRSSRKWREFM